MLASAQTTDAIECRYCGETAADAGLICWCGVTVTCSLCDGAGCRACGLEGWFCEQSAPETVEDAELMESWNWESARHERFEAEQNR